MPLWQMTGEQFVSLLKDALSICGNEVTNQEAAHVDDGSDKYAYGLDGLARLFGCSKPTANRIKQSGKIDKAIKQIGCKIIIDKALALELAGKKTGGRR